MFDLPSEIIKALTLLEESGYEAYLVGGAVRDRVMSKRAHDYDITTSATPIEVEKVFNSYKTIETGIQHGTVTVIIGEYPIEITSFRAESAYSDGRHPDSVSFAKDVSEDLGRRDFTVNAIAYSLQKGYVDLYGGIDDIEKRVIRCVGSPGLRFAEDHLRMLRAMRFSSTLGFDIEENTKNAIHEYGRYITKVSNERVFSELCKLLCGVNAKTVLLEFSDIIFYLIPELAVQKGCEEGKADLYEHTVNCLSYTEPSLHLRLAALLHDTVKPSGASLEDAAHIRETVAKNVLKRLRCSGALCDAVCRIIKYQDTPIDHNDKVGIKRLASKAGIRTLKDVLRLRRADVLSEDPKYYYRLNDFKNVMDIICAIEENGSALNVRDLALNGNDIMDLGVPAGKEVGALLKYALDNVIAENVPNEKSALIKLITEKIE